jgi:uncharacterized membrane protein
MTEASAFSVVSGVLYVLFWIGGFWWIAKSNSKNKLVVCGCATLIAFVFWMAASEMPDTPKSLWSLLFYLVLTLSALTIFFLLQRWFSVLRQRK